MWSYVELFEVSFVIQAVDSEMNSQEVFEAFLSARQIGDISVTAIGLKITDNVLPGHLETATRIPDHGSVLCSSNSLVHQMSTVTFDVVNEHLIPARRDDCRLQPGHFILDD